MDKKYNLNQNIKPRPLTPYYDKREELKNYPHQIVNLDNKNRNFDGEEQKIKKIEIKNKNAMLL